MSRLLLSLVISVVAAAGATAQPTFSKTFSPATVGPGSGTTLTFTIDNSAGGQPATGLAFTDPLPSGVTIAAPANATTTCSGGGGRDGASPTISAPAGGSSLSFSGGAVGAGTSCTVTVYVVGTVVGVHTNTTSALSYSAGGAPGTAPGATANLTVDAGRPGFMKAFAPATVVRGTRSRLTFTIDNSANAAGRTLLTFTDTLPAGLTVASPANGAVTCTGGTLSASGSTISYSGSFFGDAGVAAGATCTVAVDVIATDAGALGNTSGALTSASATTGQNLSSGTAGAVLTSVVGRLGLDKDFLLDPAPPGGTVPLRFTLQNIDRRGTATTIAFDDDLDAVLPGLVATGLPVAACGGTLSSPDGGATLEFRDGSLASEATCTFDVDVAVPAGAATGSYSNVTTQVSGLVAGEVVLGEPASDDLFVAPVPILTKSFVPNPVAPGGQTAIEFTVANSSGTFSATDIAFSDALDAFPTPASASVPANGFCGSGSSMTFFPGNAFSPASLTVSGASLAPGASCTFAVDLDIPASQRGGEYPNTTSEITARVDGQTLTGAPASDVLTVVEAPLLSKSFLDDPAIPGGTVTLSFELAFATETGGVATDIGFSDDLSATLPGLAATGGPIAGCGGTLTPTVGGTVLEFTGGTLSPGDDCSLDVDLAVPAGAAPGAYANETSALTATVGGTTVTGAAARDELIISPLRFTKAFTDDPVAPGSSVTLEFTIVNTSTTDAATGLSFTDDLGETLAGLTSTSAPAADVCGVGSQLTQVGADLLSFSGGSLGPGDTCTFAATLAVPASADDGTYRNLTSDLLATVGGTPAALPGAIDFLEVSSVVAPLFSKAFDPAAIAVGGISRLTLSIENGAGVAATGLAFTDALPAGLVVATPAGLASTCGGTATAADGSGTIELSGGSVAAGTACTVAVDVTSGTAGTYVNTTSALTSSLGTSAPASAELAVVEPSVSAGKTDALEDTNGNDVGDSGETIRYEITVANDASVPVDVSLADTLGTGTALVVGSVTTSQGTVTSGNDTGETTVGVDIPALVAGRPVVVAFEVTIGPVVSGQVCNRGVVSGPFPDVLTDDTDTPGLDATCTPTAQNGAPVANAGPDQEVTADGGGTASVTLAGAATDPDGDPVTFTWTGPFAEGGGTATGATPTVTLPVGVHLLTLTVTDPAGASGSDEVTITVLEAPDGLSAYALLAFDDLLVSGGQTTTGDVHANGTATLGLLVPATFNGNATASEAIQLGRGSTITGDATAPEVTLRQGATVQGTVTEGPVDPIPAPDLAFGPGDAGTTDVTVGNRAEESLAPGAYGDVEVRWRGTLRLSAGEYTFSSLQVGPDGNVEADVSGGPVVVNVVGRLWLLFRAEVGVVNGTSADLDVRVLGDGVHAWLPAVSIGTNASFSGLVVTPSRAAVVLWGASVSGSLAAASIAVSPNTVVTGLSEPAASAASAPGAAARGVPEVFALHLVFPNPVRQRATVRYDLPEATSARVSVYDAIGREVALLADGAVEAGRYEVLLDADRLPAGTYLVRITTATGFAQTQRLTVVR